MKTPAELREIAHRATHYDKSHGDLSVLEFPSYTCDDLKQIVSVSYRDIALVFGKLADLLDQPEPTEAQKVAQALRDELGDWTLGELGREGLTDAIWDAYPPYQHMLKEEQKAFAQAVYDELYG